MNKELGKYWEVFIHYRAGEFGLGFHGSYYYPKCLIFNFLCFCFGVTYWRKDAL